MMTHETLEIRLRYDGMTREEAEAAGYELAEEEDCLDSETIKDRNARRVRINEAMKLWRSFARSWRIARMEYLFYSSMRKELKLSKPLEVRRNAVIRDFKYWKLLECLNEADAWGYLNSLRDSELQYVLSFTQNWVKFDYAYTTLRSWIYDFRQILKAGGIDKNYVGDVLEHPEDWRKPSEAARNHRPPKTASLGWSGKYYGGNDYSAATAMY